MQHSDTPSGRFELVPGAHLDLICAPGDRITVHSGHAIFARRCKSPGLEAWERMHLFDPKIPLEHGAYIVACVSVSAPAVITFTRMGAAYGDLIRGQR